MGGPKAPSTPPDPDPRPVTVNTSNENIKSAAREEQKRVVGSFGRQKSIIAGNTAADNANKKTILGG